VCQVATGGVLQAAHLTPKSAFGSDDARNGLPLCANHHVQFDRGWWAVDPVSRAVVPRSGVTLSELRILVTDLTHLPAAPHELALKHPWDEFQNRHVTAI
jgi:predicted restriction endonuclease